MYTRVQTRDFASLLFYVEEDGFPNARRESLRPHERKQKENGKASSGRVSAKCWNAPAVPAKDGGIRGRWMRPATRALEMDVLAKSLSLAASYLAHIVAC